MREHLCVVRTMHACWCLPGVLVCSSKSGLYYATLQASGVCATRTLCPRLSRARVGGCAPNNGAASNSGVPGGSCSRLARRFVGPADLGRAVLGRAAGVGHAAGPFLALHEQDCVHAEEAEDCVYRVNTAHAAYRLIFFPAPPRVDRAVPVEPGLLRKHVRAHDQLRQEGDRPRNRVNTLTSMHTHVACGRSDSREGLAHLHDETAP